MAIDFDASTDRLTGNGITGTVGTVVCWFNLDDRNTYSNVWVLWNSGTTGLEAGFGTDTDGTSLLAFDSAFSVQAGPNVTPGTWYCMALVMNGTSWTLYHGTNPASLTVVGPNTRVALSSPGGISVSDPTDWMDGRVANLKVWSRALSAGDVAAELATYDVINATNLVRQHRFLTTPGTTNGAGTGGNLTAGSTATTTAAGPALLDANTGAVAGQAAVATGQLTGTETTPGVLAGAARPATGAWSATQVDPGAVAGSTPAPTGAIVGTQTDPGVLAGSAPRAVGALTGTVGSLPGVLAGVASPAVGALYDTLPLDLVLPLRAGVPVLTPAWSGGQPETEPLWTAGTVAVEPPWTADSVTT